MNQYCLVAYWSDILTGLVEKASCSTFIDNMTLERYASFTIIEVKGILLT